MSSRSGTSSELLPLLPLRAVLTGASPYEENDAHWADGHHLESVPEATSTTMWSHPGPPFSMSVVHQRRWPDMGRRAASLAGPTSVPSWCGSGRAGRCSACSDAGKERTSALAVHSEADHDGLLSTRESLSRRCVESDLTVCRERPKGKEKSASPSRLRPSHDIGEGSDETHLKCPRNAFGASRKSAREMVSLGAWRSELSMGARFEVTASTPRRMRRLRRRTRAGCLTRWSR